MSNISLKLMSDLSEILEQVISQKTDSLAVSKCQRINHQLRQVAADSQQQFVQGAPEEGRRTERVEAATQAGQSEEPIISTRAKKQMADKLNTSSIRPSNFEYSHNLSKAFDPNSKSSNQTLTQETKSNSKSRANNHQKKYNMADDSELIVDYPANPLDQGIIDQNTAGNDESIQTPDVLQTDPVKTRNSFRPKQIVDNDFIQQLAEMPFEEVNLGSLPYFNRKSPHNTMKYRVERGGERLCKVYQLSHQQCDQELLLDLVESFYKGCVKRKWVSAEMSFTDEQISKMRSRLEEAGQQIQALKNLKTEQTTSVINFDHNESNEEPQGFAFNQGEENSAKMDINGYETNQINQDQKIIEKQQSSISTEQGHEFFEEVKGMGLHDQQLPFCTVAKNRASMQCRFKNANYKIEKKFVQINQTSFQDQLNAQFCKFFSKCVQQGKIQVDSIALDEFINWLSHNSKQTSDNSPTNQKDNFDQFETIEESESKDSNQTNNSN